MEGGRVSHIQHFREAEWLVGDEEFEWCYPQLSPGEAPWSDGVRHTEGTAGIPHSVPQHHGS